MFDPQHLADGLPSGLRWSPVRGCHNPLTAMIRAAGLASATGLSKGGVESGGFWEVKTRTVLQGARPPGPWSRHSSRTSSRPPGTWPPPPPAPGSTRRCCSPSTRSAPRPPAIPTHADGRGRRHRHHHHARAAVAVPGPRPVGRPRRRSHLECVHHQGHPRRKLLGPGPARPVRPHRRARRVHRHRHHRRPRLPVLPTRTLSQLSVLLSSSAPRRRRARSTIPPRNLPAASFARPNPSGSCNECLALRCDCPVEAIDPKAPGTRHSFCAGVQGPVTHVNGRIHPPPRVGCAFG